MTRSLKINQSSSNEESISLLRPSSSATRSIYIVRPRGSPCISRSIERNRTRRPSFLSSIPGERVQELYDDKQGSHRTRRHVSAFVFVFVPSSNGAHRQKCCAVDAIQFLKLFPSVPYYPVSHFVRCQQCVAEHSISRAAVAILLVPPFLILSI